MKRQNYGPHLGKLVHQLPGNVTLAYDLCLKHKIPREKYLFEGYKFRVTNIKLSSMLVQVFPKNVVQALKMALNVQDLKNCQK